MSSLNEYNGRTLLRFRLLNMHTSFCWGSFVGQSSVSRLPGREVMGSFPEGLRVSEGLRTAVF